MTLLRNKLQAKRYFYLFFFLKHTHTENYTEIILIPTPGIEEENSEV